ncbi:uncharacterized protein LOC116350395 [Contarinia nasturtii]|uniref:uncharacterized protein LOC116350395 n=1 Tax=Contarinia nasturtii TaxID=265458 RepID=UPI0012D39D65|nr:uncharacterized protein LOC116350395 [Contarinia nasturtii]
MLNPDFQMLNDHIVWHRSNAEIALPIDLNEIDFKVKGQLYDSFHAFIGDIECILHNCFIHSGSNWIIMKAASNLIKFCAQEFEEICSCYDCYEKKRLKSNEWRKMVCNKLHLLLWVKLSTKAMRSQNCWPCEKDFNYWPAKFISFTPNQTSIKVIFFGHNNFVDVPAENCQLFTINSSSPINKAHRMTGIGLAIEELKQYTASIKRKFNCRFVDTLPCTPFDLERIEEHMNAMFPGYNDRLPTQHSLASTQGKESILYDGHIDNGGVDEIPAKKQRLNISKEVDCFQQMSKLKSKLEIQMSELNTLMRQHANSEPLNKQLNERLQAVTSERNKLRMNASIELNQISNAHAREVTALNEKLSIEKMKNKQKCSRIRSLNREIAKSKYELCLREEKTHQQALTENQTKIDDLLAEIQVMSAENARATEAIATMKENHQKSTKQLRDILAAGHKNAMKLFETKLRKEYQSEIASLNQTHVKVLNGLLAQIQEMNSKMLAKKCNGIDEEDKRRIEQEWSKSLEADHQKELQELRELHKKELDEKELAKERILIAIEQFPDFIAHQLSAFTEHLSK